MADRLDPLTPTVPQELLEDAVQYVSREELRAIQRQALEDVTYAMGLVREHDPARPMMWAPREALAGMIVLAELELETRARDFAAFERDPSGAS
ncbi:MAG: hypothetical protein Q8O56_10390 [Solirubrobacteraceae bacterium]|nr:hypothetical protein [Solirubrobacteraceae bacterium]